MGFEIIGWVMVYFVKVMIDYVMLG